MVSFRCVSLVASLVCLLSSQCVLGARKVAGGNAQTCHVAEELGSLYGVSYDLPVDGCSKTKCNPFKLKDLSTILEGKTEMYEGDLICRCWGKVAGKEDIWSEFYSFMQISGDKCGWEKCWELYGKVLSKRHNKGGSVTHNFDSMNHWTHTCTDAPAGLSGPSIGEVIGDLNDTPVDFGSGIMFPEHKREEDSPIRDDLEDEEELIENEDLEGDEEDTSEDTNKPVSPHGGTTEDVAPEDEEVKDPAVDNNQPTDNKPEPKAMNPKDCQSRTPPEVCKCIQQHEGDSWKKNEYSQTAAEIGNCICNLENDEETGWVKDEGKFCMGRTMQAMRELGRFACKLQKYNAHGNRQRCHPAYPGKDVTGDIARATFD